MVVRTTIAARGKTGIENPRALAGIVTDYKRFAQFLKKDTRRIMRGTGKIVLDETKPLVPRDTGALLNSGKVRLIESEKGIGVDVSFGGLENKVRPTKNAPQGIVDYAIIVHEDLSVPHETGQAKFLEKGIMLSKGKVEKFIVAELRKVRPKKR